MLVSAIHVIYSSATRIQIIQVPAVSVSGTIAQSQGRIASMDAFLTDCVVYRVLPGIKAGHSRLRTGQRAATGCCRSLWRAAAAGQCGRRRRRDAGCGARNCLAAAGIGRGRSKCGSCSGLAGGFRSSVGGVRLGDLQPAKRQFVNILARFEAVAFRKWSRLACYSCILYICVYIYICFLSIVHCQQRAWPEQTQPAGGLVGRLSSVICSTGLCDL